MKQTIRIQRLASKTVVCAVALGVVTAAITAAGQAPQEPGRQLQEPVYRISKAHSDQSAKLQTHPLDPAIALAKDGLKTIQQSVRDYTCVMVKRERIDGELGDYEYMYAKVRSEQRVNDKVAVPFSVYLYFLKPEGVKGREVIYVRDHNDDKLIAHEPSSSLLGKFGSVWLRPDGMMAMKGNRYPITEIGMENLVVRLLETGERDRQRGEVQVQFRKGAKINGRVCTMLEVIHPVERPHFDFHKAQIFIDDELNIPIRYAAWTWPVREGGEPVLEEEYTYLQVKLNQGLTDKDFDPENGDYKF
jgi:hypothetical protein